MAGPARTLAILAVAITVALAVNGFFLFRAFRAAGAEQHFRAVLNKPDAPAVSRALMGELRAIPGVTVVSHDQSTIHRKQTGRYWLGKELVPDLAHPLEQSLRSLKYPASVEPADDTHLIVHLNEEYITEAAAAAAQRVIVPRVRVSLVVMPAFRAEHVPVVILDVSVPDAERLKAVQLATGKREIPLTPMTEP